jgi:uncharacterized protein (DUF1330 family)
MPAYLIAEIEVIDPAGYEDYKTRVTESIRLYGGRYLARGEAEGLEGAGRPRIAIVEFESVARVKEWLESPEYREVRAIRHRTARSRLIAIEAAQA